jgi:tyrosine-protein kinase Etk/Wzc
MTTSTRIDTTVTTPLPEPDGHSIGQPDRDSHPLLALVNVMLMRRRMILLLILVGGVLGFLLGFMSKRTYTSSATFIPQGADNGASMDLALAASQFGLRIPASSGAWSPAVFVDLVRSRDLLAPIVTDPIDVPEERRRTTLVKLFEIDAKAPAEQVERAVIRLRNHVRSREARSLGAVELAVTTPWPSVSYQVADRLLKAVHQFNLEARRSQAAAERAFIEPLVKQSEQSLRHAEDRLAAFLERNRRVTGSPELMFERERLEREVATQQQLYGSILQKYEEARIGERRNTPVITMVAQPRPPVLPNPRNSVLKAGVGALGGGLLGLALALLLHGLGTARRQSTPESRQFFRLIDEVTPRPLRRILP